MRKQSKTIFSSLLSALLMLCGCASEDSKSVEDSEHPSVVEEVGVTGFDSAGEPTIKKCSDGSVWIYFESMPPFFAEEEESVNEFEQFELTMQKALGLPVIREDREVFIIEKPNADTVDEVKAWLESYRKK